MPEQLNVMLDFSHWKRLTRLHLLDFDREFHSHFDEIKDKIGMCPQSDLCFPFMTCEENMKMIADIRCVQIDQVEAEIHSQLHRVHYSSQNSLFIYCSRSRWDFSKIKISAAAT